MVREPIKDALKPYLSNNWKVSPEQETDCLYYLEDGVTLCYELYTKILSAQLVFRL